VAAKKRAAELHCSLRSLVQWVTVRGGFPPGMDVADRESMYRWIGRRY
jgi:hypothetical protein